MNSGSSGARIHIAVGDGIRIRGSDLFWHPSIQLRKRFCKLHIANEKQDTKNERTEKQHGDEVLVERRMGIAVTWEAIAPNIVPTLSFLFLPRFVISDTNV